MDPSQSKPKKSKPSSKAKVVSANKEPEVKNQAPKKEKKDKKDKKEKTPQPTSIASVPKEITKSTIHFLTAQEKESELTSIENSFGKEFLFCNNSSFGRSLNGTLHPFLAAIKDGNVSLMSELWSSTNVEEAKNFTQKEEGKELKPSTSFADDNEIPNNAFHIATYFNQPEALEWLIKKSF